MKKRINLIAVLLCWASSLSAQNSFWKELNSIWVEYSVHIVISFLTIAAFATVAIWILRKLNFSIGQSSSLPTIIIILTFVCMVAYVALLNGSKLLDTLDKKSSVGLISMFFFSIALVFVCILGFSSGKKNKNSISSHINQQISFLDDRSHNPKAGQTNYKNNKEKRYQVFISSTIDDLKVEREKVMLAVLKQNCFPVGMELFPATNNNKIDYINQRIADSDYFVLIIGACYGSIENNGFSSTENEYKYAVSQGIPVLPFFRDDIGSISRNRYDENLALFEKLSKFKEGVEKAGGHVASWTNADELARNVSDSLREAIKNSPRPGWVRVNQNKKRDKNKK